MKKNILLFFILLITFSACRKKEALPVEESGEPVFYVKGKLNGNDFEVKAGDEGYYMHTSVYQDERNIFVFRGDLNSDCSSACGYSLSVMLNDTKVSLPGASVVADSAFVPGRYNFLDKNAFPSTQVVSFVPRDSYDGSGNYAWTVTDSTGATISANTYSFSSALKIGRTYTVNFSFADASGACSGFHKTVVRPGSKFRTWMTMQKSGNSVNFDAVTDVAGKYEYFWDFGDGITATGKNVDHDFAAAGKYTVQLKTVDDQKIVAWCYYQVNTNPGGCENNFSAKFAALDYSKIFKTITVILKDPNGKVYSSQDADINSDTYAELIGVEDYKANANGQPTKRLHLKINCHLKDNNDEVRIENADAYIGVAY